jgi:hypothetical protein
MNYKDKYIKYKSKYLQLHNIKNYNNLKAGASTESVVSIASTLPSTKPKSVPTQYQGKNSTCWAHAYARSFVRTFQVLDIITDDKVEQWYNLFYAILLQDETCKRGHNFSKMVYLFNYLEKNIDNIFTITKEKIRCVETVCSVEEKDTSILEFNRNEQNKITEKLRFVFENKLIFLAIYPYAVNPDGINLPTKAIKNMLDLRLQPAINMVFTELLDDFLNNKTTETYDLLPYDYDKSIIPENRICDGGTAHTVVLRSWKNNRIEIKNSWGPNGNFAINDLKDLTCQDEDYDVLSKSIIDFECLMIDYNKLNLQLPGYSDFKIKVDNKIAIYLPTIDPSIDLTIHNYECSYDKYGFPYGENCELKDNQGKTLFKGNLINGMRDGLGTSSFLSDSVYKGNWKDNLQNGYGIYESLTGYKYEGNWKDGAEHGLGKNISRDGVYSGNWKNGNKHGIGEYRYNDHSVYGGYWKDNKQNGYGIMKFPNGDIEYEGEWKDGNPVNGSQRDDSPRYDSSRDSSPRD